MRSALILWITAALAGCGGGSTMTGNAQDLAMAGNAGPDMALPLMPGNSITGTANGRAIRVTSAYFTVLAGGPMVVPNDTLYMTEQADACGDQKAGIVRKDVTRLRIILYNHGMATPGTYTVPSQVGGITADAYVDVTDSNCMPVQPTQSASGGSVKVDTISDTDLKGTFDLQLNSDHLTGMFLVKACAAGPTQGICQ